MDDLEVTYRGYLTVLNERRFEDLSNFVHDDLQYNGAPITRDDYARMLRADVAAIPDLVFRIELLVVQDDTVAARLWFDCVPATDYFGLPVQGRHVEFAEHVFYRFRSGRIDRVWSLIDTPAISAQVS
ncbi:ester cyclase [uncultured Jatrophihabitans sp.]|uniref:ester cyclase n=1 Tax=uncultured Jatrophihabitans sp. TaxID=1610747 RepID=UPI0035CAFACA